MTDHEFLTIDQAAALLQVSTMTIRRYIKAGDLDVLRMGQKTIRIPRDAIDKFRVPTS